MFVMITPRDLYKIKTSDLRNPETRDHGQDQLYYDNIMYDLP